MSKLVQQEIEKERLQRLLEEESKALAEKEEASRQQQLSEENRKNGLLKLDLKFSDHFQLMKVLFLKKLQCLAKESQVRENFAV